MKRRSDFLVLPDLQKVYLTCDFLFVVNISLTSMLVNVLQRKSTKKQIDFSHLAY